MSQLRRQAPRTATVPSWAPWPLWALALLAAVLNIRSLVANAKPLGVDWRAPGGTLLDFRDLVVVPGRYLWQGGNPYDPVPYLAAHPWAQEFDPYSPAWLLISAAIGWMPLHTAALVYLCCMTVISVLFARMLARWISPYWAAVLTPAIAIWFQVWFPARGMGSSFLVVLGMTLTLTCLRSRQPRPWLAATGLALAVLKPQFGIPFALALLALGHYRLIARGALLAVVSALPPLVACVVAAGGVTGFAGSIMRVIRHATSPAAPTGLLGADSYRVDMPGLVVRVLGRDPGPVPAIVAVVVFALVLVLLRRLRPGISASTLVIAPAIFFLPVHLTYDIILMALVAAAALDLLLARRTPLKLATAVVACIPVLHLHRISAMAGLSGLGGDLLDAGCTLVALLLGCALAITASRSDPALSAVRRAAHDDTV